mgnify:CR=1 FL=1
MNRVAGPIAIETLDVHFAYPEGIGRFRDRMLTWNAGSCCGYAMRMNSDDVGFPLATQRDLPEHAHPVSRSVSQPGRDADA